MKLKPLYDWIIVESPEKKEKVTSTGLVITPHAQEDKRYISAKIISCGKGKINKEGKLIPMDVKVGDIILFSRFAAHELEHDDKKLLAIQADKILGKIL